MITMRLGGVDLGDNFPLFARSFEYVRQHEEGGSFRRVKISLSGFVTAENSEEVMFLYDTLKDIISRNDTTFTYIDTSAEGTGPLGTSGVTVYNEQPVWIGSYAEPFDEFAKWASGDYGIELYHFEENDDDLGIVASYAGYTFESPPSWSRQISPNRETHRAANVGSTATIRLGGFLFANSSAELQAKIDALSAALNQDGTLNYGSFSQSVRRGTHSIEPAVLKNWALWSFECFYDIGEIVSLRRKVKISRVHDNPVITEEPFCSRRLIELMNSSAQTIEYRFSIEAESIETCRTLLAVEAANVIEPGGIEMPGGEEVWDYDRMSVDLTVTKFYSDPVYANLPGT